ncbi:MAG: hypothetical protein P8016_06650 [Sedimentisphaerales bacterium]
MKNKKDEKWLDEKLSSAIDFGQVKFDAQKWKRKFILNESETHSTIKPHKKVWRLIMESKATKYSAAAVIALAFVLVLLNPFGGSKYGGVVLADVQKRVANIETCIIRGTKTFTNPAKPDEVFEFAGIKMHFDLVKYFSKQYGLVEEGYVENELIYRITLNRPQKQALLILPRWKKYMLFNSTNQQMQHFLENVTPDGIVNMLLENTYKELGRGNIDGVNVEGYEFQNAERFKELFPKPLFNLQDAKGKVWIGVKEQLPVQVEGNMRVGKCIMTMLNNLNLHEFNTLGDYNIKLDGSIFNTSVPDGYTELTLTDILSVVPASVKAGAAGAGLSIILTPAGVISWRRYKRKKMIQVKKY